ncbi:MAG: hypothetical protein ACI4TA_13445 [Acetatifactor sp.]
MRRKIQKCTVILCLGLLLLGKYKNLWNTYIPSGSACLTYSDYDTNKLNN